MDYRLVRHPSWRCEETKRTGPRRKSTSNFPTAKRRGVNVERMLRWSEGDADRNRQDQGAKLPRDPSRKKEAVCGPPGGETGCMSLQCG
jgi:hypothetical protein